MVDGNISTRQSHALAEEVRHALYHAQPRLNSIVVHVNPDDEDAVDVNEYLPLLEANNFTKIKCAPTGHRLLSYVKGLKAISP